jgi:hypothetical protein
MQKFALVAVVALIAVAGCAKKEEVVVGGGEVTVEPTYTGKYK